MSTKAEIPAFPREFYNLITVIVKEFGQDETQRNAISPKPFTINKSITGTRRQITVLIFSTSSLRVSKTKIVQLISLTTHKEIIKDFVDIVINTMNVFIMHEFVF